jgi:hypothetical protein
VSNNIGEKTHDASDKTIMGYVNSLYQHIHNQAKCYPTLANGVIVTGGAGAWALGNFVEVIPANAITSMYDIHFVVFEGASATDIYELVLYRGAIGSEVEIGRIRADRENAQSGVSNSPIQIPALAANTRVSAKVASKSGGDNVTISIYYHTYA